jgi:hypothetical protein
MQKREIRVQTDAKNRANRHSAGRRNRFRRKSGFPQIFCSPKHTNQADISVEYLISDVCLRISPRYANNRHSMEIVKSEVKPEGTEARREGISLLLNFPYRFGVQSFSGAGHGLGNPWYSATVAECRLRSSDGNKGGAMGCGGAQHVAAFVAPANPLLVSSLRAFEPTCLHSCMPTCLIATELHGQRCQH